MADRQGRRFFSRNPIIGLGFDQPMLSRCAREILRDFFDGALQSQKTRTSVQNFSVWLARGRRRLGPTTSGSAELRCKQPRLHHARQHTDRQSTGEKAWGRQRRRGRRRDLGSRPELSVSEHSLFRRSACHSPRSPVTRLPPRGRASARWIGRARCGPIGSRPLHDLRRPTDQHAQLPLGWPCHGSCACCTGSNRGRGRRDIARLWTETTSSKSGQPRCRTVVAGDVAAKIAEFLGCAWLTDAKEGGQARR